MPQENWAERWVERVKRRPVIVLFSYAAALLAVLIVLGGAATSSWHWFDRELRWKQHEYSKLHQLKAGFDLEKFREVLGSPVFQRRSDKGVLAYLPHRPGDSVLIESSFQGRDFWVQSISDEEGTVLLYAVTSCGEDFRPTFRTGELKGTVTLNESTLDSVKPKQYGPDYIHADYFIPGATANSRFFDSFYGGNPGNYKTFAWGINDACPDWQRRSEEMSRKGLVPFRAPRVQDRFEYKGLVSDASPSVLHFRETAIVNTYAEAAPFVNSEELLRVFQIGVDRLLIRTVYEGS